MPARFSRTSRFVLSARHSLFRRSNANPAPRPRHSWARGFATLSLALLAATTLSPVSAQSTDPPAPAGSGLFPPKSAWDAPEPWRTDRFYLQTSIYTWHFHYDVNHKQSAVLDLTYRFNERWLGGQWLAGGALFTNSFGQFSQVVYGGLLWRPLEEHQQIYLKVGAGVLHGYSGAYKDKIPYNSTGFAPAIVPSAGYCWGRYCGELVLLGANALQFTVGVTLP
jgi:hypothetical protein